MRGIAISYSFKTLDYLPEFIGKQKGFLAIRKRSFYFVEIRTGDTRHIQQI